MSSVGNSNGSHILSAIARSRAAIAGSLSGTISGPTVMLEMIMTAKNRKAMRPSTQSRRLRLRKVRRPREENQPIRLKGSIKIGVSTVA